MTVMTKVGNLDNIVTYEHVCDFTSDLELIDPHYITLGSTAIVLHGTSGLEVYMADSEKTWVPIFNTAPDLPDPEIPEDNL